MSETLSTLIAFVGFLILLSILVQSLQEGLKNLLKLKTGIYERFFINLYKEEFFNKDKNSEKSAKEGKHRRWWEIWWSGEFVGEFDKRMGRLKKTITNADKIFRDTKYALRKIAELDSSSSDSKQRIASSIKPVTDSLAKVTGLRLDLLFTIYDQFIGGNISRFHKEVLDFLEKYDHAIEEIAEEELEKCSAMAKELLKNLEKVERKISDYRLQIEGRMDAWLAQLNEVYRRNMLKWTVALGAVIVLIFNADSFTIYRYLATHDVARAVISQKVEGVIVPAKKATPEDLNKIDGHIRAKKWEDAKKEILSLSTKLEEDFKNYKKEDKAKRALTIKKEVEKIKIPPTQQDMVSINAASGRVAVLYVDLQKTNFDTQLETLTSLGIPLGWGDDLKKREKDVDKDFFWLKKIGGLILTIFLISFGAPFWNDIFSALTGFKNRAVKEGKS